MHDPTTTLDPRYSAPDASPTSWDVTRSALESAQLFWLTTVRADGRPALHASRGDIECFDVYVFSWDAVLRLPDLVQIRVKVRWVTPLGVATASMS